MGDQFEIAGVVFEPTDFEDEWVSLDGRIVLTLHMATPRAPWRLKTGDYEHKREFPTPYAAVLRAIQSGRYKHSRQPTA